MWKETWVASELKIITVLYAYTVQPYTGFSFVFTLYSCNSQTQQYEMHDFCSVHKQHSPFVQEYSYQAKEEKRKKESKKKKKQGIKIVIDLDCEAVLSGNNRFIKTNYCPV